MPYFCSLFWTTHTMFHVNWDHILYLLMTGHSAISALYGCKQASYILRFRVCLCDFRPQESCVNWCLSDAVTIEGKDPSKSELKNT